MVGWLNIRTDLAQLVYGDSILKILLYSVVQIRHERSSRILKSSFMVIVEDHGQSQRRLSINAR